MTVPVKAEIAHASTRRCAWTMDRTVRRAIDSMAGALPDGTKLVFSAMNRLYAMDFAGRHTRAP